MKKYLLTFLLSFVIMTGCVNAVADPFAGMLNEDGKLPITLYDDVVETEDWAAVEAIVDAHEGDAYDFLLTGINGDNSCNIAIYTMSPYEQIDERKVYFAVDEKQSDLFKSILNENGKLVVPYTTLEENSKVIVGATVSMHNGANHVFHALENCESDKCRITLINNGNAERHTVGLVFEEKYSDDFKKITTTDTVTLNSTSYHGAEDLISNLLTSLGLSEKYNTYNSKCNADGTKCEVVLLGNTSNYRESHVLKVKYDEKFSDEFKKAIPGGKIVADMIKPSNFMEADFFFQKYFYDFNDENTYFYVREGSEDLTKVDIVMQKCDENGCVSEVHKSSVEYQEVDKNKLDAVNNIIKNLPEDKTFIVDDLELVNYLYHSGFKNEDTSKETLDGLINYSSELRKLLGNKNITASLDVRGGGFALFLHNCIGGYVISYDGISYGVFQGGASRNHVIYVPDETGNTTDAYVEAAQKRIDDFLGEGKVTIKYTGKLSDLEESDHEELQENDKMLDAYYTLEINGEKFLFLIAKDSNKMKTLGEFNTSDLFSNISIFMDSSKLPLDTSITVSGVNDAEYKKLLDILKLSDALVYDLKLYSFSRGENITKLEDGTFEVRIPIDDKLLVKDLIVYYVDENGKVTDYDVEIDKENKLAIFKTDHFSVYTLADKASIDNGINNPQTFDGLYGNIIITLVSSIGLIYTYKHFKKEI